MKAATVGRHPSLMRTNCFGSAGYPDASETRHVTRDDRSGEPADRIPDLTRALGMHFCRQSTSSALAQLGPILKHGLIICGLCTVAAVGAAQAPDSPAVEESDFVITAESNLVVVPLHVYDRKKSVNGLGSEAFELREDGVLQDIAFVEGPADEGGESPSRSVPTEIMFLIDFSYSVMKPGLLDFTTVRRTMLEGLRDDVMISVYGFANTLKRFTGPTRDLTKLQWALDQAYESETGGSRVYEAIIQTARDASKRGANVSRMMVVFSDGLSTTKLSPDVVVHAARAFGIPLYPVVLGHQRIVRRSQRRMPRLGPTRFPSGSRGGLSNSRAQESRMQLFADIGPKTGGRSYDLAVLNSKVIGKILGSLSQLAETEYVIGYYPRSVDEELTAHEVRVNLVSEEIGKLYGGHRLVVH